MMFVDTSAFFALADRADNNHAKATEFLALIIKSGEVLFTHPYVIVETVALMQRRLGMGSVQRFLHDMESLSTIWIDENIHAEAVSLLLNKKHRHLSLVDCASFVVMRKMGAQNVFGFDNDFKKAGFHVFSE